MQPACSERFSFLREGMPETKSVITRVVDERIHQKTGLLVLEVKELKQEVKELRKKYNLLHSRVRSLESERAGGTDFGV